MLEVLGVDGRRGRDRDLEPGRLARGDVRQRDAHRRALARRRGPGRPTCGSASARATVDARLRRRRPRSSRTWATVEVGPSRGDRRASSSCRSPSATRTRSSSAIPTRSPRIGPLLETHPRFPERTNVQVARVDGPGDVTARVWERGVGETSASGTSAVAVAAATHGERRRASSTFPGGDLRVRLERSGTARALHAARARTP